MWPLIRDFFTTKSAAIRAFRVIGATMGTMMAAGTLPIPEEWQWVGYVVAGISAAATDQRPNKENRV